MNEIFAFFMKPTAAKDNKNISPHNIQRVEDQ